MSTTLPPRTSADTRSADANGTAANGTDVEAAPIEWFRASRHEVRHDAELMEGLDGRPLLFIGETGRYIAVGRDVGRLLPLLDGTRTGDELIAELGADRPTDLVAEKLARLLHGLRQAGALTEEPAAVSGRRGIVRFMRREHLLRLPLTRSVGRALEPLVAPLRVIPGRRLVALWTTVGAIGFALGMLALFTAGGDWQPPAYAWLIYPLIFVQIASHEFSHALVCQYLGVPVREAGVGLMLYVMPVGYVDRTDAYRVRDRRSRAFLSLAGPLNDQIWFGATGVVAMTAPGEIGDIAFLMLIFQLLLTLMNVNPVVPSDGYHAVSALVGEVNVRGQALSYLAHRILRTPLTAELAAVTPRRRRFFIWYGVACLAFVALLVVGMLRTVGFVIGAVS